MDKEIAKKYALALFDISKEKNKIDTVKTEIDVLADVLDEEVNLRKFLKHPKFTRDQKKNFFDKVLNQISNTTKSFIYVLIDNQRILGLNDIYTEFIEVINNYNDVLNVIAYTKNPLNIDSSSELKSKLESKFYRKVNLINEVDKSLVAGVRLEFDGQVIDDTIRTKLDNLKATLMQ